MPPTRFAALILAVIAAAGATVAVWAAAGVPLVGLGLGALVGALILGWRGWRR
jgi:hypothetical protein